MKVKKIMALLLMGVMAAAVGTFAVACNNDETPDEGTGGGGNENEGGGGGNTSFDYTLDETEYYLVGTGAGDLKENGWSNSNHVLKLERDETADHNVFSRTIDMYAGDAFQICYNDSWDGQMGITYMQGVVEDGDQNVVKDSSDNIVFYGAGIQGIDITLSKGFDAKYTFSLHTFPEGDKDAYITYTKGDDLKPQADMYLVGSFNDFGFSQKNLTHSHMTQEGDIWRATIEITAEACKYNAEGEAGTEFAMIAVRNEVPDDNNIKQVFVDEKWEGGKGIYKEDEYNLVPAGVYTVTYNSADGTVTIKEGAFDMYFIGSMNDWKPENLTSDYALTATADNKWTGYLTITEDDYKADCTYATVKLYNKLGKADSTYFTATEGDLEQPDNNIKLTAGDYFFSFDIDTKAVSYEKLGYFVVGTFVDADGHIKNFTIVKGLTPAMEAGEDNTYSAVLDVTSIAGVKDVDDEKTNYDWVTSENGADTTFAIKVVYGTELGGVRDWHGIGDNKDANYLFKSEGKFTITYNTQTQAITVEPVLSEVTVTFDLNCTGATGEPEEQTITSGTKATKPTPDPERTGFTFDGWYTADEGGTKFDFENTPVTTDTVLYAHWIDNSQIQADATVTFDYNYGAEDSDFANEPQNDTKTADAATHKVELPDTPSRDGYYFLGWFTEESAGEKFDADTVVTETQTVYAHWRAKDTHQYRIVGKFSGVEKWTPENPPHWLTHSEEHPTENVFTISIRLFAGDEFKILGVDNWEGGYVFNAGCLRGGNGELGGSDNIVVNVSGDYVLYAKTDGNWELTWTVEPLPYPNDMYFVYNDQQTKMTPGTDAWTGYITVDGTKPLTLIDKYDNDKEYNVGDGNLPAGDYFVKFNVSEKTVEYEKCEYYVVGSFLDNGEKLNFEIKKGVTPKLDGSGTLTCTIEIEDVTGTYERGEKWNPQSICNIKVVYGTELGQVKSWDAGKSYPASDGDGNYYFTKAGTYTITFDVVTGAVTIAEADSD